MAQSAGEVESYIEKIRSTYKPQVFEGDKEPATLASSSDQKNIFLGVDSDKDGVRDDLEVFINRNFKYDYEREIYKEIARKSAFALKQDIDKKSREELQQIMSSIYDAQTCFTYLIQYNYMKNTNEYRNRQFVVLSLVFSGQERQDYWHKYMSKARSFGTDADTGEKKFSYCPKYIKKMYPFPKKN